MSKVLVRMEHVSKRYRLGLTRTSLPTLLWGKVRNALGNRTRESISHPTLWALKDVSFDLKPGKCLALIGPNGAGKTTILKLLSRITQPSEGVITVKGRLSALIELGAGFHPDMTGRENIFLNGSILGIARSEIRRRFDEIVAFSELERFIDTPVKRYSSGMSVRLGFAVAACMEPDILLVDEVLAVGDASFRQKCMQRIHSLLSGGTSIIFVSHNLYMVQAVCEKALYLRDGRIRSYGEAGEVIDAYEQEVHSDRISPAAPCETSESVPSHKLRIKQVHLDRAEGDASAGPIPNNSPVRIRVVYQADSPIGPVHVSLFIRRSDGLTCCMVRTSLNGFHIPLLQGEGEICLALERLQLSSGAYCIEAFLLNGNDSVALTPLGGRSSWFSVKGAGVSTAADSGVFEPLGNWSHRPAAVPAHRPKEAAG